MLDKNSYQDSLNNTINNLTEQPSQNIGKTISDIWFLIFGNISHVADKRRIKYSYALEAFETELNNELAKIAPHDLIEPDFRIIAETLEASKYCIELKELRNLFCKLIAASANINYASMIQPIYIDIISKLTPYDCLLLKSISYGNTFTVEITTNKLYDIIDNTLVSSYKLTILGVLAP